MSFLSAFGIGEKAIIEGGAYTNAVVTEQKTLWWCKINTKAVRFGPMDGAVFPGFIRFTYVVEGIEYKGCRFVSPYARCPVKDDHIKVYYNSSKPEKFAVKI